LGLAKFVVSISCGRDGLFYFVSMDLGLENEIKNVQNDWEFVIIGFVIDKYNFSPYHKTTTVDAALWDHG